MCDCSGDCNSGCNGYCVPVGPRGADGANGTDGIDGTNGVDGINGVANVTYIDINTNLILGPVEALLPGATYAFTTTGTVQVFVTASHSLRTGTPTTDTVLSLYLDGVLLQDKAIIDTISTTSTNMNTSSSFLYRGAVTIGQVLEVRGILGTGSASAIVRDLTILINQEA